MSALCVIIKKMYFYALKKRWRDGRVVEGARLESV